MLLLNGSRRLRQFPPHPTPIKSYSVSRANGARIFQASEQRERFLGNEPVGSNGSRGNGVDLRSPSGPVPVEARLISYNDKPLRPRPLPRFCSPKASKSGGGAMI